MEKVPQGAGSGTIWDTDGHVVTNAHVIAGASDLQVCQSKPNQTLAGDEPHSPPNAFILLALPAGFEAIRSVI